MSYSQLRPLSFGEILDGAFTLYRRHFSSLILTALVPMVPLVVLFLLLGVSGVTAMTTPDAALGVMAGSALVMVPLYLLAWVVSLGGMTYQLSRAYMGMPVGPGEALKRGLRRCLPLTGAGILVMILAGFGILAFCIGYFIVLIMAFAVPAAVVIENKGPFEALQRSYALSKDALGEVFLTILVAYLIASMPAWAVQGGSYIALFAVANDPTSGTIVQVVSMVLGLLVQALTLPFSIGVGVLLYYDRRVRTEALDVQMAAERLATA